MTRFRRIILVAIMGLVGSFVVSCTPPTVPTPDESIPSAGHGKDPGVAVAPSSGCQLASIVPPRSTVTLQGAGGKRRSLIDAPAAAAGTPRPVLLSLHPFLFSATQWDEYSGLSKAAVARGFIVVTPFGSEPGPRWAVPGGLDTGTDDMSFISELLNYVEDNWCVDRNRVFAAGFSAGAAMAQALSCAMPTRFAAVAGSGGMNLTLLCPDAAPTDVLIIHGTADPVVPMAGSAIAFTPPVGISVAAVAKANAQRDGCGPDPATTTPHSRVRIDRYEHCRSGARVVAMYLNGAGHTWAGSPNPLLELFTGATNTQISATDEVIDFFTR